jgi:hypothetical protein
MPIQGADISVKNTSGSALAPGQVVKLDTSNPMSATQPQPGVVLTSAVADYPYGVVVENIPVNGQGRVQIEGQVQCIAAGAVSVGAIVGASTTAGDVTTYTAANPSLGQAVTVAVNAADPIFIRISVSKNA